MGKNSPGGDMHSHERLLVLFFSLSSITNDFTSIFFATVMFRKRKALSYSEVYRDILRLFQTEIGEALSNLDTKHPEENRVVSVMFRLQCAYVLVNLQRFNFGWTR